MIRFFCFSLLAGPFACEEKASEDTAASNDTAGTGDSNAKEAERKPTRLEKALTQLEATANAPDSGGPPPGGIYSQAQADAVLAPGAATKVEVARPGNPPRRVFRPAGPGSSAPSARDEAAQLSWTWQGKSVPTIEFKLDFRSGTSKKSEKQSASPLQFKATVKKPRIAGADEAVRKQLEPLTAQFAGATLSWNQARNGATTPLTMGDTGGPTGEDAARFLSGLLSDALVAFPSTPVGQGALWMTTSRETMLGFETITLRMMQLKELTADGAIVSVTTHRYATSDAIPLPGAPADAKLAQFGASSNAEITLASGAALPTTATVSTQLDLVVTVPTQPGVGSPVRATAQLVLGDNGKAGGG